MTTTNDRPTTVIPADWVPGPGQGRWTVELGPKDVVQPDILVILNESRDKMMHGHVIGAPDLVVEIASHSTMKHDKTKKQEAYASAGVREYWIAEPVMQTVEVLLLGDSGYHSLGVFSGEDTLPTKVVPDFHVPVRQFFV